MPDDNIQKLVCELGGMKRGKAFSRFIDYIVFPKFRSIASREL